MSSDVTRQLAETASIILGGILTLRTLRIDASHWTTLAEFPFVESGRHFHTLGHFSIFHLPADAISRVLSSMRCPLTSLKLQIMLYQSMYLGNQMLIAPLTVHPCRDTLTSISLCFKGRHKFLSGVPDQPSFDCHGFFAPLFSLTKLELLEISAHFILSLDDSWLSKATIAFPKLHTLKLAAANRGREIPKVTLGRMICLAQNSRHLRAVESGLVSD